MTDTSPTQYRIRIRGHLGHEWSTWFDDLTLTQNDDGTTELTGPLPDQAALYGVLSRLRDMGASLLTVERLTAADGAPVTGSPTPSNSDQRVGNAGS
jgi:hypothetical protein